MIIKILGPGCAKCKTTHALIEKVAHELNLSPTIEKVEDIQEIMKYDVLTTPVVVIDEVVKIKGRVPTESEIKELLKK
jgi:small redox-active disulfide protein 2